MIDGQECSPEEKTKRRRGGHRERIDQQVRLRARNLYLQGKTYAEVGRELGRPQSTIKSWSQDGNWTLQRDALAFESTVTVIQNKSRLRLRHTNGMLHEIERIMTHLTTLPLPKNIALLQRRVSAMKMLTELNEICCKNHPTDEANGFSINSHSHVLQSLQNTSQEVEQLAQMSSEEVEIPTEGGLDTPMSNGQPHTQEPSEPVTTHPPEPLVEIPLGLFSPGQNPENGSNSAENTPQSS